MCKTIPSQAKVSERTLRSRELRNKKLMADPTCRVCGKTKTFDDFPKNAVDYACTACRGEYAAKKYHERRAKMSAEELSAHKAKINNRQNKARKARLSSMPDAELIEFRKKQNEKGRISAQAVKDEVYAAYGGYICACCGETEKAFLSIDHIYNDGAEHKRRENLQTGEQMHRWIKRHNFPPGFQVLCMNCNWGKRMNNGICPKGSSDKCHEAQRTPRGL